MLSRQQQPHPRNDDRERVTRARHAAEALFTSKPPVSGPSVPDSGPANQPARKPRVLQLQWFTRDPRIDVWRTATLMLKRYGEKALEERSTRADQLDAEGDPDGAATCAG